MVGESARETLELPSLGDGLGPKTSCLTGLYFNSWLRGLLGRSACCLHSFLLSLVGWTLEVRYLHVLVVIDGGS